MPTPNVTKTRLITLTKWLVALSLVAYLLYLNREGFSQLRNREWKMEFLITAYSLWLASMLITFVRWRVLVRAINIPFSWADAIRLGFWGCLWSYVGPGAVGGDVVKAYSLAKNHSERRVAAISTVFLDRVLGVIALLLVGGFAGCLPVDLPPRTERQFVAFGLGCGALVGLTAIAFLLIPGLPRWRFLQQFRQLQFVGKPLGELLDAAELYQQSRLSLVFALGLSILGHLGMLTAFFFCGLAVNPASEVPGIIPHFQLIPAAELAGVLPITPGGIGTLEAAVQESYVWCLAADAAPESRTAASFNGLMAAIAFRLASLAATLTGVAYLALFGTKEEVPSTETSLSSPSETPAMTSN